MVSSPSLANSGLVRVSRSAASNSKSTMLTILRMSLSRDREEIGTFYLLMLVFLDGNGGDFVEEEGFGVEEGVEVAAVERQFHKHILPIKLCLYGTAFVQVTEGAFRAKFENVEGLF